jgi:hypothetical protein
MLGDIDAVKIANPPRRFGCGLMIESVDSH